jgi:hypothetical protein
MKDELGEIRRRHEDATDCDQEDYVMSPDMTIHAHLDRATLLAHADTQAARIAELEDTLAKERKKAEALRAQLWADKTLIAVATGIRENAHESDSLIRHMTDQEWADAVPRLRETFGVCDEIALAAARAAPDPLANKEDTP